MEKVEERLARGEGGGNPPPRGADAFNQEHQKKNEEVKFLTATANGEK